MSIVLYEATTVCFVHAIESFLYRLQGGLVWQFRYGAKNGILEMLVLMCSVRLSLHRVAKRHPIE